MNTLIILTLYINNIFSISHLMYLFSQPETKIQFDTIK